MGASKAPRLHLRDAGIPARHARDVPIMTLSVVPHGVVASVVPHGVMTGVMRVSVMPRDVVRPCRSRSDGHGECRRTQRQRNKRPAERIQLDHTQLILFDTPNPRRRVTADIRASYASCVMARARRDAAVQDRFQGHSAIIS